MKEFTLATINKLGSLRSWRLLVTIFVRKRRKIENRQVPNFQVFVSKRTTLAYHTLSRLPQIENSIRYGVRLGVSTETLLIFNFCTENQRVKGKTKKIKPFLFKNCKVQDNISKETQFLFQLWHSHLAGAILVSLLSKSTQENAQKQWKHMAQTVFCC